MDAIEALRTRRSIRSFETKPVPMDVIETVIDCARLAPSANNIQPWEFIVVTDATVRKRIADLTDYGKFIAQAPVCIAVYSKDVKHYLEDCSAATENILVAAHALRLGTCWVAGYGKSYGDPIAEMLGVPKGHKLVALIALGYPAQQGKAYNKRSLKDVLHFEKYGKH
ncbi:MAG: nitroreductase family protein [bacterium]